MSNFASIRTDRGTRAVRIDGDRAVELNYADVGDLLRSGSAWRRRAEAVGGEELPVSELDFAPPVTTPEKIICVGLNYADHAAETGKETPSYPQLFAKFALALIGAHDTIELPDCSDQIDWEAELALVIGAPARHVSEADAHSYVAGYTVANDVSVRDWQRRTGQYLQGKTFEATTPVGPWMVPAEDLDAGDLRITCEVDGETVQDISTRDMIFGPAALVSYISQIITLDPGDLIITGTGAGIGARRTPPRYLTEGNVLTTSIEGIGTIENRCLAPAVAR
ncbi:MAG: 2-hydroxyhepta-2,4-diene-1,7-dioate isomerase [Solirubrobacterales bacterium 70-9]|nr:MAG: 2-hydroxyhepta-2,4-diene-1,7-dioate isomerase [Solirubrobacterales bacterium 70-9]